MTWNEFYMQTTGDNFNSGSTTSDSASVTVNGGSWNQTSRTFTASSGTPFVSVSVGEWASIWLDGAATTQFVGKISSKTNTTITLDSTNSFGPSNPSTVTGTANCKIGGAWADFNFFSSFSDPSLFIPLRINIKNGTYNLGSTSYTLTFGGSNGKAFELRGYDTTPGDIDTNVSSNNRPVVSMTTGLLTFTCTYGTIRNLYITGNRNGFSVSCTQNTAIDNCYIENTNTNAAATVGPIQLGSGCHATRCWLVCQNTSQTAVNLQTNNALVAGCYIEKGRIRISTGQHFVLNNIFMNCGIGVDITGAAIFSVIYGNTFVVDAAAISFASISATVTQPRVWFNNLIVSNSVGLEMNTITDIAYINRLYNCYYTTGTDEEVFTDWPSIGKVTASAYPVEATGELVRTSNARNAGFPGSFQSGTNTSYPDIGALHRNALASSGLIRANMSGNIFS